MENPIINTTPKPGDDLSGSSPEGLDTQGLSPNILVLNFKNDFSVNQAQQYTLWQDAWEVYIGRFVNPNRDGIFLYDRTTGEARIMDFDSKMLVDLYQEMHNLTGNWEVHTGDFNGSGRAQVLLYDPSSGDAQFLVFASNLSLAKQISNSGWGRNLVLYVGHFGMPSLSVMLYDQQAGQSTFIAFDRSLKVAKQYTVQSWDQSWQILVGAFLDRSACLAEGSCATGDDILVLNRQTGQVEQFVFSFGNHYKVFDNRSQSFLRNGIASTPDLSPVDATSFSMLASFDTSIHDEELY